MTIHKQFKKALKCGLGEAYFLLQQHPEVDFSPYIKKAILKRNCNDGQCEGTRDSYLFKLISISKEKDEIVKFIIKKLREGHWDWYVLRQLYRLATHFYFEGYTEAKYAVFHQFKKELKGNDADWDGIDSILKIEGFEGLEKLMRVRGRWLKRYQEKTDDDIIIHKFESIFPIVNLVKHTKQLARKDNYIQYYLDAVKTYKQEEKERKINRKKRPITDIYTQIKEIIGNIDIHAFRIRHLANQLEDKAFEQLALDFEQEDAIHLKERYCAAFIERKYPLSPVHLFFFLRQQVGRKSRDYLLNHLCKALSPFSLPNIRPFALKQIRKGKNVDDFLYLLINNYKKKDKHLISQLIKDEKCYDGRHDLIDPILDIYTNTSNKGAKNPLETLYYHTNCGLCRLRILRLMKKRKVLSSTILEEIQHDSYDDIRLFYAKHK